MPASFEPPPLESDEPPLTVEQLRKLAPEQLAHALAIAQTASEWVGRRTKATLDRGTQVFALFSSSSFLCVSSHSPLFPHMSHPILPICHTPFSPHLTEWIPGVCALLLCARAPRALELPRARPVQRNLLRMPAHLEMLKEQARVSRVGARPRLLGLSGESELEVDVRNVWI